MNKIINSCLASTGVWGLIVCTLLVISIKNVQAKPPGQVKYSVQRQENTKMRESLVLPFAFSTDDMGTVIGIGAMATGLYQKQMTVGGTIYGGGDSKGLALSLWDYRILDSERFFFSAIGMVGDYPLLRAYSPLPEDFSTAPRPGSNDSSFDDFIQAEGSSNWWDVKLEYVLPWGSAEKQSMASYQLQGGLLKHDVEQADWNPLKTGTSILIARQFNRYQEYRDEKGELSGAIHALELGFLYDNTDFPANPSQGSSQYIGFSYNPEWLQSNQQWTFVEVEASKYFSLGATSFAKQNIIALNAWLGYSPSWQVTTDAAGNSLVTNNAPFLEGATLGGMYRMRGFRQNRFHDKAVIYATAEYRMTLDYNPIADVRWLKFLNLDWFQMVFYMEGGRVSPTLHRDTLFSDWKVDAGVSLRALTAGIVVRLDFTQSKEGTSTWLMVGHPF
ncbi:BamA/TamA family outer membrane protein [Colwellia piezophila]|uniref:BamA/TamA family outer membrane protein n=1 Tax=Colwellia piezophila TaxID=211668 RepID=UPI000374EB68|nr:BamA/TamA family outer membrane protein [Colwellia piezophila]